MMNRFDKHIDFYFAGLSEVDDLMLFFRRYWNPSHIFSQNKEFFLYEFGNSAEERLNFLIAREKATGYYLGIYGFYEYSKKNDRRLFDLAGGPSRVIPECRYPMLGLELYKRLPIMMGTRSIISIGLNKKTSYRICSADKYWTTGKMTHWYRLNKELDTFKIAKIIERRIPEIKEKNQIPFKEYHSIKDFKQNFRCSRFIRRIPYKDEEYIQKRYFCHPVYGYKLLGIANDTVLIGREVEANENKAFRIVDVLGDVNGIKYIGSALDELMETEGYEYVDLLERGVPEECIKRAGFTNLDDSLNIIPNYFEPFEQCKVEVFYSTTDKDAVIFKADADQDRPSII